MREGIPLDDDDRRPWLLELAGVDRPSTRRRAAPACSPARRSSAQYRDLLRDGHPSVWFAHVSGPQDLITDAGHPAHRPLHAAVPVPSQFATLEPLQDDEPGRVIPASGSPEQVVDALLADLERDRGPCSSPPESPVIAIPGDSAQPMCG